MRRKSRELALQMLFETEFDSLDASKKYLTQGEDTTKDELTYADSLVQGVIQHRQKIDSLIQEHSSNWKIQRMALVDRNILRVAIFELNFSLETIPPKTVINEAIEVAKKFGSTESKSFVNGILDQIAKASQRV